MRIAALAIILVIAGCAGSNATRADVALAIACDSYRAALVQIIPHKASLSDAARARIDAANKMVKPACGSGAVMDPSTAVGIVERGIAMIEGL